MPEVQTHMAVVAAIIFLALAFDYINGFHDAANAIATVVSTRVLPPRLAVAWAAFFNVIAYFIFSHGVAHTIGKGVVDLAQVNVALVTAGIVAAIIWNLITWYYGIPSSSSHTLIGGYAGAAVMMGGWSILIPGGLLKIALFIVLAPVMGFLMAFGFMVALYWIFQRTSPQRVTSIFRRLQLFSSAAYSLGHGGNDAQKTMGIILAILISAGYLDKDADIPAWVAISCYSAMGLGTLAGGWRIVKTMGQKICLLQPPHGFCAETAGAISIFVSTWLKIPVSTTHVITGSIVGVGATRGLHAVKWGVARTVVWAWFLTIPISAFIGALLYIPLRSMISF